MATLKASISQYRPYKNGDTKLLEVVFKPDKLKAMHSWFSRHSENIVQDSQNCFSVVTH